MRRMVAVLAIVAGGAFAVAGCVKPPPPPPPSHCISPLGTDLNNAFGVPEPLVAPFCTKVPEETRWRAIARWATNLTHEVVPPGYQPSAHTPIEDFENKFLSAKYVVDAGTAQERTYVFAAQKLARAHDPEPGLSDAFWASPPLAPLSEGDHVVDVYIELSADHWDGFGTVPAENLLPAGETLFAQHAFEVDDPD